PPAPPGMAEGQMSMAPQASGCSTMNDVVCGTDGKTYPSSCSFCNCQTSFRSLRGTSVLGGI
uniref:Kazal-like domain-containing protein n=1 Tax=Erpetoichthys calabaricus TaxID=27687 RepID=A0A8C4SUZ0_ERPCA